MSNYKLSKGIRGLLYSYLPFKFLINHTSKLRRSDREHITFEGVLDQKRVLKISGDYADIDLEQYVYCIRVMSQISFTKGLLFDSCEEGRLLNILMTEGMQNPKKLQDSHF